MATTISIPVGGMTCAVCAQRVEKALLKVKGVSDATVNYANEKAVVTYERGQTGIEQLREAIQKAGYTPLSTSLSDSLQADQDFHARQIRTGWIKFALSALVTLPLLYLAMVPMLPLGGAASGGAAGAADAAGTGLLLPYPSAMLPTTHPIAHAITQLVLAAVAVAIGYRFFVDGTKAVLQLSPSMDTLIALGVAAAFLFSTANTIGIINGNHHLVHNLFFEAAATIVTLILLGKNLEAKAKGQAGEAIKSLMRLAPQTAIKLASEGARESEAGVDSTYELETPVGSIEPGDLLLARPGSRIAVDGIVLSGTSAVDESLLSGESLPVDKKPGDLVYAATLNTTGALRYRAEKVGADTALSQIISAVEEAQGRKAPIARLADKVAGIFVPIVCLIALGSALAWYLAIRFGATSLPPNTETLPFVMNILISVLVIACPCALGLATPVAIMVGTGKGAEMGILIRSGEALEKAGTIDTVILDKTGTVTIGRPTVVDIIPTQSQLEYPLLAIAASAERDSEHPLAKAIVQAAEDAQLELPATSGFQAEPGLGVRAELGDGKIIRVGNAEYLKSNNIDPSSYVETDNKLQEDGKTTVFVAVENQLAGILALADTVKPSAAAAIRQLSAKGFTVKLLTGDSQRTASAIAKQLGITEVIADVLPQQKASVITALREAGQKVAMVGDGINDAPALIESDLGLAIGSGTDIAIESADIVLTRGDPLDVSRAIELSHLTLRAIKQNLFWAFAFNATAIPIAAGALYAFGGPLLNPIISALAMSVSSLTVMGNALRLKAKKL